MLKRGIFLGIIWLTSVISLSVYAVNNIDTIQIDSLGLSRRTLKVFETMNYEDLSDILEFPPTAQKLEREGLRAVGIQEVREVLAKHGVTLYDTYLDRAIARQDPVLSENMMECVIVRTTRISSRLAHRLAWAQIVKYRDLFAKEKFENLIKGLSPSLESELRVFMKQVFRLRPSAETEFDCAKYLASPKA